MKTRVFVILFAVRGLASAAKAQPGPGYLREHGWTFRIGRGCYGLCQERVLLDPKYGGGSFTLIYFGKHEFAVKMRAGWLIASGRRAVGRDGSVYVGGAGRDAERLSGHQAVKEGSSTADKRRWTRMGNFTEGTSDIRLSRTAQRRLGGRDGAQRSARPTNERTAQRAVPTHSAPSLPTARHPYPRRGPEMAVFWQFLSCAGAGVCRSLKPAKA